MLAIAPSNYGKSHMIAEYVSSLVRDKWIHPSRILLFSRTWKSDPSQSRLISLCSKKYDQFTTDNCHEFINYELLNTLFQTQK